MATKSWGSILAGVPRSKMHDGQHILMCELVPHKEMCQPAIGQYQESIATIMG